MTETSPPPQPGLLKLAIDFSPLLVFLVVYQFADIYVATGATMAATVVAILVSKFRLGGVSAALWLTGGLAVVFGGLTIALADERFIKIKPTIVYTLFAVTLLVGLLRGRPLLKAVLGAGFPRMAHAGWIKLSRNWALFFAAMAIINELVWRSLSTGTWVQWDTYGALVATLAFSFAQLPIINRYGEAEVEAPATPPPG